MNILFAGLGGVGQRHLRNLLSLRPDANIGAFRHRNRSFEIGDDLAPDHSVDIVKKYRIRLFADLAEGIAWRPDGAVVANPSSLHAPTALALVRAGIPVLLEKPIAHDLPSALALRKAVSQAAVPVAVGFMQRFHPATRRMLDWLAADRIGPLLSAQSVCHNFLPTNHSWETMDTFYLGRRALGGGVVLSESHNTDLIHLLFGLPSRLWALGGRLAEYSCDVEDTVSILFDYRRHGRPFPVSMHISMVEQPAARTLSVNGARGRIEWDLLANRVGLLDAEGQTREILDFPGFSRNTMFLDEMRAFLNSCEHKSPANPSFESAFGGHLMAAKILESLDTGNAVTLDQAGLA